MYIQQLFSIFPLEDEDLYIPSTVIQFLHPSIRNRRRTYIGRYPKTHGFSAFACPKDRSDADHQALLRQEYGEFAECICVGEVRKAGQRGHTGYSGGIWKLQAGQKNLFEAFLCSSLILFTTSDNDVSPSLFAQPLKRVPGSQRIRRRVIKQLEHFAKDNQIPYYSKVRLWQKMIMPSMKCKVLNTIFEWKSKRWIISKEFDIEPYINLVLSMVFHLCFRKKNHLLKMIKTLEKSYVDLQGNSFLAVLPGHASQNLSLNIADDPVEHTFYSTSLIHKKVLLHESDLTNDVIYISEDTYFDFHYKTNNISYLKSFSHSMYSRPLSLKKMIPVLYKKRPYPRKGRAVNRGLFFIITALVFCVLLLSVRNDVNSKDELAVLKKIESNSLDHYQSLQHFHKSNSSVMPINAFSLPDLSFPYN